MAFAYESWIGYAVAPLFALGGVATPAQSLLTSRVNDNQQGQLQGVMASLMSLAGIVGPVLTTAVFFSTKSFWIGTVWIAGAALYLLATPLFTTATESGDRIGIADRRAVQRAGPRPRKSGYSCRILSAPTVIRAAGL